MTWTGTYASMAVAKGTSTTNTNNYYPGTPNQSYTSTRFYKNSLFTIAPVTGYIIKSIVFAATTEAYASALQSSAWTNATAVVSGTTVTITPTVGTSAVSATIGGTCGFTNVTVKYHATSTITLNAACTDGTKFYGTYSNSSAFVVPEDLTVSAITLNGNKKIELKNYDAGDIVAAGEGLLITATVSGNYTVSLSNETGTSKDGNLLVGTGNSGIEAATMNEDGYYFYRLTMAGTPAAPGFWWKSDNGAGFDLAANKAYLKILKTSKPDGSRGFSLFEEDETTGINTVENVNEELKNAVYYNLNGQRIANPNKGLYIVNGKKVIIK